MVYGIECHSGSKQSIMLTGILVSASLAVVLAVLHCFLCPSLEKRTWYCDYSSELTKITSLQKKLGFRIFAFEELEQATKGFTDRGRLWTFDYGFVYAGVIDNDSPVAIEKIQYRNKKEISFLLKNIRTLSTLSHVNLLKFIGCSVDATSGTLFLVYAFCVNGSLQDHLQRKDNFELNWINRVNIALGIAKALSYLRFEVSPAIYHHDLTTANVFLDHDGIPKVALLCSNSSPNVHRIMNEDYEIYNFGMVLLETITGSKPIDGTLSLSSAMNEDELEEAIDPVLLLNREHLNLKLVKRATSLGLRCVCWSKGRNRPSMLEIKEELERIRYCTTESNARTSLQETFSNSSLLQMVSISPDSSFLSSLPFNANSTTAEHIISIDS